MAEIHINVGMVALSRGFITLEAFAKGMRDARAVRSPIGPRAVGQAA